MAAILKSRDRPIPNGFVFRDPATGYQTWGKYPSFTKLVDEIIAARLGNPGIVIEHHLATDRPTVEMEADRFNAEVARSKGWNDFIREGGRALQAAVSPPSQVEPMLRTPAPSINAQGRPANRAAAVVAGSKTIIKWLASGADAVAPELAYKRASVCVDCPKNKSGDWTEWFTVPISNEIRRQLQRRKEMDLSTALDDKLFVCSGCLCPLPLKIHMGIKPIMDDMPAESFEALHEGCWIIKESKSI